MYVISVNVFKYQDYLVQYDPQNPPVFVRKQASRELVTRPRHAGSKNWSLDADTPNTCLLDAEVWVSPLNWSALYVAGKQVCPFNSLEEAERERPGGFN